jgi:heat shock protein HtpX|tara:strand:+ start:42862 stop:43056 length:195 start_codon:yes stop_codon:yes gene_type:complete
MNKNNALVAVSTELLQAMTEKEVEALLAHEVSHIANGDMITMGLLQGLLNTFVILFSRIIGNAY